MPLCFLLQGRNHCAAGDQPRAPLHQRHGAHVVSFKYLLGKIKGIGTRDLIWLKVVSLDRSWLVGLTDDL